MGLKNRELCTPIRYCASLLKKKEIPVITEVELAYEVSESILVGILVTNGKTKRTTI